MKKSELRQIIKEEVNKVLNDSVVFSVKIDDGEYEQVIYIKNTYDKKELKQIALSKTQLKPKNIKISKLSVPFSELDSEEKNLFQGNIAVFEPESID